MDEREILVSFYQEDNEFARHHEELRATAANVIVAVAAGGLGVITFDQNLQRNDIPLAVLIVVLGLLGAVLSAKHYERVRLHLHRARQYADRLDQLMPDAQLNRRRELGTAANAGQFPRLTPLKLHWFWVALNLVIALIGFAIIVVILRT